MQKLVDDGWTIRIWMDDGIYRATCSRFPLSYANMGTAEGETWSILASGLAKSCLENMDYNPQTAGLPLFGEGI